MEEAFIGPDGCHWDSYFDYVWSDVLGFCGCHGDSTEEVLIILKKLYEANKNDTSWFYEYKSEKPFESRFQELTLFILDKADITEHGSSVRGSWLTEKGVEICKRLFGGVSHE